MQGLVAKVVIADEDAQSVPVVPVTALLEADGRAALVFVVARRRPCEARRGEDRPAARRSHRDRHAGLAAGDRVVTDGAAWLDDDAAVRVLGGGLRPPA